MSNVLRHQAVKLGLKVSPAGYVNMQALLKLRSFAGVTPEDVRREVNNNEKQRFALLEAPLEVTGAGGSGACCNGIYNHVGWHNGKPKFRQVGGTAMIYFSDFWKMSTQSVGAWHYSCRQGGGRDQDVLLPPLGVWATFGGSAADAEPPPRVAEDPRGDVQVRANQGHTGTTAAAIDNDELCTEVTSAAALEKAGLLCVHGTYWECWPKIKEQGLLCMGRKHIHFATKLPTDKGLISGMRGSCEILIYLDVARALADGMQLWRSANDVLLSSGFDGVIPKEMFARVTDRAQPNRRLWPEVAQTSLLDKERRIPGLAPDATAAKKQPARPKKAKPVPDSWDDDDAEEEEGAASPADQVQSAELPGPAAAETSPPSASSRVPAEGASAGRGRWRASASSNPAQATPATPTARRPAAEASRAALASAAAPAARRPTAEAPLAASAGSAAPAAPTARELLAEAAPPGAEEPEKALRKAKKLLAQVERLAQRKAAGEHLSQEEEQKLERKPELEREMADLSGL